jgi:hypothetical protein
VHYVPSSYCYLVWFPYQGFCDSLCRHVWNFGFWWKAPQKNFQGKCSSDAVLCDRPSAQ